MSAMISEAANRQEKPDLAVRVRAHCRKQDFFQRGDRQLLAVSGGLDSVVLTHLMAGLRREWGVWLCAVHLNHMMRGVESDRDEDFVRRMCSRLSIPLVAERHNVPAYCREQGKSLEMGAREVRYDLFERACRDQGCCFVLTGHHANDQAETILSNLLRGSGLAGLRGIPPRRGIFLRPLLPFSRTEIAAFAHQQNLDYVHDSSNIDPAYRRNKIRTELVPLLEQDYNPNLVGILSAMGENLLQVEDWIQEQAREAFPGCVQEAGDDKIILDIHRFLAYFKVLQKYILGFALDRLAGHPVSLDYQVMAKFNDMLCTRKSRKELVILPGLCVRVEPQSIVVFRKTEQRIEPVIVMHIPCTADLWQEWIVEIKADTSSLEQIIKNPDPSIAWVDASSLTFPLVIRPPRSGDWFYPLNSGHRKKISDFFIDAHIPFHRRGTIPVVMSKERVVWIAGQRLDDRFKVGAETTKLIKFSLRDHE